MPAAPAPAIEEDQDEHRRVRLMIALLGFVAGVQIAGMLGQGVHGLTDVAMHGMVVFPAAGFAIALRRGLLMRIGIIAFALIWSMFSIWAAIQITRVVDALIASQPGLVAKPVSPWFARIVAARGICFTAAAIVLVTGRPTRGRRVAGLALGALFAVLFVIEHGYQLFH